MKNKKRLIGIIVAVTLFVIVASIGTFSYAYDVAKKNSVGIDKALNIALTDAGTTEENITVTKAKMGFEKNIFVYDIEFVENNVVEYDYTIKASDGTILEKSHEIDVDDDDVKNHPTQVLSTTRAADESTTNAQQTAESNKSEQNTQSKNNSTTQKGSSNKTISLEEAKNIALKNAGISKNNADFVSAHKDYDDGIAHYDIEFKTSSYEYEYEIDMNGNIISVDKEAIKKQSSKSKTTTKKTSANSKYIGIDKAKKIALSNSGRSAGEVTFTKAKLEKDDGIYIYEIEFETSTTEYEYEINAETGKIIDKSAEPIDD